MSLRKISRYKRQSELQEIRPLLPDVIKNRFPSPYTP